jgi:anti-sigma regulatory factor (Ser/Thr protein kinase)
MPRRWRLGELAEATVLADRDRLAVALDALLENAVAHTAAEDRIEVSARLDGGCAVFAVTDDGCGIPAAELDRIFARFARVRPYRSRAAGGFGLGLPIVQAIAEALCVPRISSAAVICRVDLLAGWRVLAGAGPSREQGALRIRVEGQGRPGRLTPGRLAVRLGRDLQPSGASVPLVPGGLPAGWRGA